MSNKQYGPTFKVVFNGEYVTGRDPKDVRNAFIKRFNEKQAIRVFDGESVTVKKNLSRQEAFSVKGVFIEIGMLVDIVQIDAIEPSIKEDNNSKNQPEIEQAINKEPVDNIPARKVRKRKILSFFDLMV